MDAIRLDHEGGTIHYVNILSIGFSATVGALTNRRYKRLGAAGYGLAVVSCVAALQHPVFPIRVDEAGWDARPCTFLSFCNSRFTGGTMMMAPGADPADGRFDLVRAGPMGRLQLLRAFPRIYHGTHVELPLVETSQATTVEFRPGPATSAMVDGEVIALTLGRLRIVPGAIEVIA